MEAVRLTPGLPPWTEPRLVQARRGEVNLLRELAAVRKFVVIRMEAVFDIQ
jgi:hypothetical protein